MAANCGTGVHQGSPFNGSNANHGGTTAGVASASKLSAGNGAGNSQALKHDPGLAQEWTADEQSMLEDGLQQFSSESNILKYIKIAALLPEKTVRDVALRCRWMSRKENGKRRKGDEQIATKKPNRKEKFVDLSWKQSNHLIQQSDMVTCASPVFSMDNEGVPSYEQIGGTTGHLLEQNAKAFEQITTNLAAYRIQENISLLCRARDNIGAILNDMKDMHGIMSQMPPLPVKLNEDLADSILPMQSQMIVLDSSSIHLKQEMR
uniref:Myb-like domain-containing protein n=1 Tax=Araucaria cunninghamii TaxID=56994 RepID=A0A0D6R4F9_ARACU